MIVTLLRKFFVVSALFIFCFVSESFAQNKWQALEATLADSSTRGKINFYTNAAKGLFLNDKKQARIYALKGEEIAGTATEFRTEYADLNNLIGVLLMYDKAYEEADARYQKCITLARQLNNKPLEKKALTNIALNSSFRGEYQKAITQNFELLNLMQEGTADDAMIANVYANLSNAYSFLSQNENAEKYQLKALPLFKKVNNQSGVANALNTLATIYTDNKKYAKAASYLQESVQIKRKLGDSLGVANAYLNLAVVSRKLNNAAAELKYSEQAAKIYIALKEEKQLAMLYINLGSYYSKHNDWEKAAEYEQKALPVLEKLKDPYLLSQLYDNMATTAAHFKNADTALAFSKKALLAKDSMYNSAMRTDVAGMEVKYETAKKESQIKDQKLELQQKQNELIKRNYTIGSIAVVLLAGMLITYLYYKRNKLKQTLIMQQEIMKQQDLATLAVMQAEENERSRIARELHDGVGQMMSVAKMNLSALETNLSLSDADKMQFENTMSLVDASCKEVREVAHTMMPNALLKAGLTNAIKDFLSKIDHRSLKINFSSEGLNERLGYKTETVLYRVVQEAANNVLKHSGANVLDISLIKDADGISVTIEDNGKGFDMKSATNSEGIGLKNIESRIAYLQGTVEWSSAIGKGTLVAVHIPASNFEEI